MSVMTEQTADQATGVERMTYREALRLALREELTRDERVFIMGEEVGVFEGSYKVTAGLMAEFGADRVRDTPISEEGFVGAAVGAAMGGERPIVEIMTINFLLVAMDQVVNHAAKVRTMFGGEVGCPMVIRTPNGAGNQLTAQHSQSLEAWFAGTPGLKVVTPANPADAKGLLKSAVRDDDPVLVVENLPIYKEKGDVPLDPEFLVPIGRAAVPRAGSDITIVSHSFATVRALQPEVVLGHDPWKRYRLHPDHRHAGLLACEGIVASRDPHFFPEQALPHHRPDALLLFEADEPDHVEDVTGFAEHKIAALHAHTSQLLSTMDIDVDASPGEAQRQSDAFDQRIRDRLADRGGEAFKLMDDL